jgi:hypothetical protein
MARLLALAAAVAALTLALPALARAATYCVNAPGCSGINEPDLQSALITAQGTTTVSDTVQVGNPGSGTTGYGYTDGGNSANEVTIVGAGTSGTLLTRSGAGAVLTVLGEGSTISHLTVQLPSANATGVDTTGSLEDVNVTTLDTTNQTQTGAFFHGAGPEHWFGGSIQLAGTSASHSGVTTGNVDAVLTVQDVSVQASGTAFQSDVRNGVILRRVRIAAAIGVVASADSYTLDNVSFLAVRGPGICIVANNGSGSNGTVSANHVSAFGNGVAGAQALNVSSASPGLTTTVNVKNSIFHGFDTLLARNGSSGEVANIGLSFDETDVGAAVQDSHTPGSGSTTDGGGNIVGDPLWTNAAAGDFSLQPGSPAIDEGDPAGLAAGDSATDILGAPRISNGRTDIGAVEVQQPLPSPPVLPDTTPPTFTTSKLPARLGRKRLLAGITFTITPSEPSSIDATLAGSASSVKLAKNFNLTLAHRKLGLAAGRRRVTLKVRKKLLGKSRRFSLQLTIVAADAAGNKTTLKRTIKVR